MTSKQRRALDRMFRDALGESPSTPDGRPLPQYRWMQTTELFYFMHGVQTKTPGGIFFGVPQDKWTRHCWAGLLGRVWILAQWLPPVAPILVIGDDGRPAMETKELTEQQWLEKFKAQIPYPSKGRYCPITGSELDPGMEPCEELTALAIDRLLAQKTKSYDVHLREIKEESERDQAEVHKQFAEELDEWWGIDGHTPGMKDSTAIWTEPLTKQPSQPQNA